MIRSMNRRAFLRTGGSILAGLALHRTLAAPAGFVEVQMVSDELGGFVSFDPIGLYVEPGTTVRWRCVANVHTTTAYHPANDDHPLRIPRGARPWNSGYLKPGDHFQRRFEVPGVYDYYCIPHEAAGMVGRIVVGAPSGPGARPFDYFRQGPDPKPWRSVPDAARRRFPAVAAIMRRRRIPAAE